jgi:hypothetical protein
MLTTKNLSKIIKLMPVYKILDKNLNMKIPQLRKDATLYNLSYFEPKYSEATTGMSKRRMVCSYYMTEDEVARIFGYLKILEFKSKFKTNIDSSYPLYSPNTYYPRNFSYDFQQKLKILKK